MLSDDLIDVPVEVLGGYCPAIVPANLPPGAANVAQDVMFPMAGVRQRGGLGTGLVFTGAAIPAGASINGLKTFLTSDGSRDLMIWDSLGDMFKEDPQGVLNLINSRPYQNLFCNSQTLFGREYQAFSNALGGFDIPRQYDDTNWDRVSQVGPGASPVASDVSFAIVNISRSSPSGIIVVQFAMPYAAAVGYNVVAGALLNISGVAADATFNGQFPIYGIFSSAGGANTSVTLWGAAGSYPISGISRAGGVVTATLEQTPTLTVAESIIIIGSEDPSYDGQFTVSTINGNTVTWAQAGANSVSAGGFLYIQNFSATVLYASNVAYTPGSSVGLPGMSVAGNQVAQFVPGATATIAGNSDSSWNATWTVSETNPPIYFPPGFSAQGQTVGPLGITLVYLTGSTPSSAGTGGTATASLPASTPVATGVAGPAGHIAQGLHNVSVAFITRQGYITKGAPWTSWNAAGGFFSSLAGIPTGPPNISQRLLLFTPVISPPATTGTFYSVPTGSPSLANINPKLSVMLIPDNVTTSATIDFSDAILISSFQAEYLFSQLELGESACMLPYNARTAWLGERAKVPNFNNLTFDGGWTGVVPDGWTLDATNGAGGTQAVAGGVTPDWGDAYVITGTNGVFGKITQSAYQDDLQVAIIQPNTSYSVRVRLKLGPVFSNPNGTLFINLHSPSGGFTTVGLSIPENELTAQFAEFTAALTDTPLANPPSDLVLQLFASFGNLAGDGSFVVDSIEVFPTLTPVNSSIARFSYAFNPEGIDSITGQVQVRPGDGQQLRAGFPLRNSLYLAKDHYLGYVADDGVNEPSSWAFTEVSATVGICGPNAVDWNEEWAVFAERSGLYICWGSDPVKITPEIQNDATNTGRVSWASINWSAATTIWVRIDKVNKMILVGAPINGATTPNIVFMLDYKWLESGEDIAASPFVGYSQFTGKILGHGRGRRWAIWNIAANSMCFAERADGTAQPFFGGVLDSTIFWQQDCEIQSSDNGVAIDPEYESYALPSAMEEQQFQLRAHRKLLGYQKFSALGAGTMGLSVRTAQRTTILRGYTLSLSPTGDGERPVNVHGERFYLKVGQNKVLQVASVTVISVGFNIAKAQFTLAIPHTFNVGDTFTYAGAAEFSIAWHVLVAPPPNSTIVVAQQSVPQFFGLGDSALGGTLTGFPLDPNFWFQLEKLIACVKKDSSALVRGVSS
jgi:hypothetical protein